jgi:hypothetical protein
MTLRWQFVSRVAGKRATRRRFLALPTDRSGYATVFRVGRASCFSGREQEALAIFRSLRARIFPEGFSIHAGQGKHWSSSANCSATVSLVFCAGIGRERSRDVQPCVGMACPVRVLAVPEKRRGACQRPTTGTGTKPTQERKTRPMRGCVERRPALRNYRLRSAQQPRLREIDVSGV